MTKRADVYAYVTKRLKVGTTPPNEVSDVLTAQTHVGGTHGWALCVLPTHRNYTQLSVECSVSCSWCRGPFDFAVGLQVEIYTQKLDSDMYRTCHESIVG